MTAWQNDARKSADSRPARSTEACASCLPAETTGAPWGDLNTPTDMFNGNISPVHPLRDSRCGLVSKAESNGPTANLYRDLFSTSSPVGGTMGVRGIFHSFSCNCRDSSPD